AHQLRDELGETLALAVGRAVVDAEVLPLYVSELTQPVEQRRKVRLVLCPWNGLQDADGVDLRLRARRHRPRHRAAEQGEELAPPDHPMPSLAMASSVPGTSRPSASGVCRLTTTSNLVACRIGRSAGFSPLRIRPE